MVFGRSIHFHPLYIVVIIIHLQKKKKKKSFVFVHRFRFQTPELLSVLIEAEVLGVSETTSCFYKETNQQQQGQTETTERSWTSEMRNRSSHTFKTSQITCAIHLDGVTISDDHLASSCRCFKNQIFTDVVRDFLSFMKMTYWNIAWWLDPSKTLTLMQRLSAILSTGDRNGVFFSINEIPWEKLLFAELKAPHLAIRGR